MPDTQAPAAPTGLRGPRTARGPELDGEPGERRRGVPVYRARDTSTTYTKLTDDPVTGTSYTYPALTPGVSYRYQLVAVDTTGNASPRTDDVMVTGNAEPAGSGTYENTSSQVVYSGTWSTASSGSDSAARSPPWPGPATRSSLSPNSVRYVARKANYLGIANVYLDGKKVATVDLYSATNQYKQAVYTSPTLSYGTHTIRVERSGNKNAASAGRTIDVDSFVVPDSRPPATPTGLKAVPTGPVRGSAGRPARERPRRLPGLPGQRDVTQLHQADRHPVTGASYTDPALTPGAATATRSAPWTTPATSRAAAARRPVTATPTRRRRAPTRTPPGDRLLRHLGDSDVGLGLRRLDLHPGRHRLRADRLQGDRDHLGGPEGQLPGHRQRLPRRHPGRQRRPLLGDEPVPAGRLHLAHPELRHPHPPGRAEREQERGLQRPDRRRRQLRRARQPAAGRPDRRGRGAERRRRRRSAGRPARRATWPATWSTGPRAPRPATPSSATPPLLAPPSPTRVRPRPRSTATG